MRQGSFHPARFLHVLRCIHIYQKPFLAGWHPRRLSAVVGTIWSKLQGASLRVVHHTHFATISPSSLYHTVAFSHIAERPSSSPLHVFLEPLPPRPFSFLL